MRKRTAPHIRKTREASSRKPSGLIAQDLSAQQSATPDSVLDNRSHRTLIRQHSRVPQDRQSSLIGGDPRSPFRFLHLLAGSMAARWLPNPNALSHSGLPRTGDLV